MDEFEQCDDLKKGIRACFDSSRYPDVEGKFENLEVKIEDVDIAEHFIDIYGVHDREKYTVKTEYDHFSGLSEQLDKETFGSPKSREKYQQETASSEIYYNSSIIGDATEEHKNFSSEHMQHKCELCDYVAKRKIYVKYHVNSVHLNKRQHKCHLCKYSANRRNHLKRHIDTVHLNLKHYKCDLCEYFTNQKGHLKRHVDTVHLNFKPHKCHFCEYSVTRNIYLKNHILKFHWNEQFT